MEVTGQLPAPAALSNGQSTTGALGIWRIWGCQNWFWYFAQEKNLFLLKDMNHFPSVIPTVEYRTDRTILAGLEILNWYKIWSLGDSKLLKYLGVVCVCVCVCVCACGEVGGVGVNTGLFSSLLNVVNSDYRILTLKVWVGKWSWPICAWQDWENPEKLQAVFQSHSWVWHRAPLSVLQHTILSLHKQLHIYNMYDYGWGAR